MEEKKIGKEIEPLENTLHGAKSELQGQTEEANRVNISGTGQSRYVESKPLTWSWSSRCVGRPQVSSLHFRPLPDSSEMTDTNASALTPAGKGTSEFTHPHPGFQVCLSLSL